MIALRHALAAHFGATETRTVLLRLREAGLLPEGAAGRGGSAAINPSHAVLALLALNSGFDPIEAPAAAVALGDYRLSAMFAPYGQASRQPVVSGKPFLAWAIAELSRAAISRHRLQAWQIEPGSAIYTVDPGHFAPVADVARANPELAFQAPEVVKSATRRITIIGDVVLREVAAALAPPAVLSEAVG